MNKKAIEKLKEKSIIDINEILDNIPDLDVIGIWVIFRKIFKVDDVIEIIDRPYENSKKMVEHYLEFVDREIDTFEIIEKFGIDLKIAHKIMTELLNEGKVE